MRGKKLAILACMVGVLALAMPAGAYDVYKAGVPDVNKDANIVPNESCWQATAANMLGAAGWGLSTQTAQQNADAIYGQLTAHFGLQWPGYEERAINWWLYNYGYNPNAPDPNYYDPTKTYNDVTHVNMTLNAGQYEWLLLEANRCQSVAVSFMKPNESVGHVMTLVGGNYSTWHVPPGGAQQSVWHDSDDMVQGDNPHTNAWQGANNLNAIWYLDYWNTPGDPNDDWLAENYTTLCPGLQKPQKAIEYYDVAWYRDLDTVSNVWYKTFRVAGAKKDAYAAPNWDANHLVLTIGNEYVQDYTKTVYLLVDYTDRNNNTDPGILLGTLTDPNGLAPTSITYSEDNGQILLEWDLSYQPDSEWFLFPSNNYYFLSGDVKDFNVATICIPEPMTAALLGAGALLLLRRRRS